MSVRIENISTAVETVLKVAGRLQSEDVGELTRVHRSMPRIAALDLSELQSADEEGLEALRGLIAAGAEIRRASPYIEILLRLGD